MSDNERRIFPMETALELLAGKGGNEVLDLLGFTVQRQVCEKSRPTVAPMVKGWLYSLHPDFMKVGDGGGKPFAIWAGEVKKKLGDNISLAPMPAEEQAGINAYLDAMQALKDTAAAKTAEAEDLAAKLAEAEPFKARAEELEKKLADLEEKNKAQSEEISSLKSELSGFSGKIALNESEIEQSVKDMVSRAVKDALAALPVGVAAGAAAGASGDDAAAAEAPAAEAASSVPDDFGFGTSGADNDGFGF